MRLLYTHNITHNRFLGKITTSAMKVMTIDPARLEEGSLHPSRGQRVASDLSR
jgi:hypothetical protein